MANTTVYPYGTDGSLPSNIGIINDLTTGGVDKALSAEQGKVLSGKIGNVPSDGYVQLNTNVYTRRKYTINSSNQWTYQTADVYSILIPLTPGIQYKVVGANVNVAGIIAVLAQGTTPNTGTPVWATGYDSRISVTPNEVIEFIAPNDAQNLYVLLNTGAGVDVTPSVFEYEIGGGNLMEIKQDKLVSGVNIKTIGGKSVLGAGDIPFGSGDASIREVLEGVSFTLDENGWELPTTSGMVNALKKAAQATEIVYTAKAAYPNNSSSTGGAAGEHTGMPYSSTKAIRKYVGWEVSQRTFMTAVNNPYGLFYTEDISASHKKSGYGFNYNGVNCGTYYGMVCSIFALWCLGYKIPWDTEQFDYLGRIGELLEISEQSSQGVHICDIIWMQGHTVLVTGVQRDQYGNVINVHTSESYPNNMIVTTRTASQFDSYLATNSCIIYRPVGLYKNTGYVPSEFVAVRGESTPAAYQYNDDICFFAGDYAAWRDGDDCWLNYTKGGYTSVKIYKDNNLIETVALSNDSSVHKLDVSSYMDGYGSYKACLTDGNNDSDFTYWKLVDTSATYQNMTTYQRVSWTSNYGTPLWIQVCSSTGVSYCWHEITSEDITNGYADLDIVAMIADQYDDATPAATKYVRVLFGTDYGCVVSPMVQM